MLFSLKQVTTRGGAGKSAENSEGPKERRIRLHGKAPKSKGERPVHKKAWQKSFTA